MFGLALLALAPLLGCGGPPRVPGPPGETLILLENRVGAPCELTWANARVDDRPLRLMTIAPPGAKPAPLDRPILKPGEHTVSIAASATCEGAATEEPAVLQVTQPIYMGREGGAVTISVARKNGSDGLEASFAVQGGHLLAPRADGDDVDCRSREPMDRAICRTEASLARAQQRHDAALVVCITDKLRDMRLLAGTASQTLDARKPQAIDDAAIRGVAESVEERVVALAIEAEYCVGLETDSEGTTRMDRPAGAPNRGFR